MSALAKKRTSQWIGPLERFELCEPTRPVSECFFAAKSVLDRDGRTLPLDVFIPVQEGNLLYSLVRYLRPIASLEVGLANGVSAVYIAQGLQDNGFGSHLAIDPFQTAEWNDVGLVTLKRAGLDKRVALDQRPSHWVLPDLEEMGQRIQFAFIDGSHLFDYVMADFLGIDRILDVGGLVAFDDSDWPAVAGVIRFALANLAYEVFEVNLVVEPSPIRPRWSSRCIRSWAKRVPALRRILRPDFVLPAHHLGILGRCVVLKKKMDDARDSQTQQFVHF